MRQFLAALPIVASLSGCATSITVPVAVIGSNGEVLRGTTTASLAGGSFSVSDGQLSCGGVYDALDRSPVINLPVLCNDGRKGFVVAHRMSSGTQGYGFFRLTDGTSGDFVFGHGADEIVARARSALVAAPKPKTRTTARENAAIYEKELSAWLRCIHIAAAGYSVLSNESANVVAAAARSRCQTERSKLRAALYSTPRTSSIADRLLAHLDEKMATELPGFVLRFRIAAQQFGQQPRTPSAPRTPPPTGRSI